jgi:branched-chain amino acid transport system permease protein
MSEGGGVSVPARDDVDEAVPAAMAGPSPWWTIGLLVLFTVFAPILWGDSDYFGTLVLSGIWGIAAVGLSLLAGYAGQISLGQAAIVGLGAYGTAIATVRWNLPPLLGMGLGIVLTLIVAGITSAVLRLRGLYLALATLALGILLQRLYVNLDSWTGGSDGYPGIGHFSVFGIEFSSDAQVFRLGWGILIVGLIVNINIVRSRFGRGLVAIHEDEDTARALGVPTVRYKVATWLIAAVYAGIAGSLYAHRLRFISPQQFGLAASVMLIAAVIIGGMGSLFGPVAGMVLLRLVPEFTKDIEWLTTTLFTGLMLIFVMVFFPGGLAEIWHRLVMFVTRPWHSRRPGAERA